MLSLRKNYESVLSFEKRSPFYIPLVLRLELTPYWFPSKSFLKRAKPVQFYLSEKQLNNQLQQLHLKIYLWGTYSKTNLLNAISAIGHPRFKLQQTGNNRSPVEKHLFSPTICRVWSQKIFYLLRKQTWQR